MANVTAWTIAGANGEPIIGDCHEPPGKATGVIVVAHGFKGYKDYGMFPRLAVEFAAAGFVTHRFNFSHSGMTNRIETFERPDLFERDTWNQQVHDLRAVIDAVAGGTLAGRGLPHVTFGHSRGGVTVLLTAARDAGEGSRPVPAGVVAVAAPSRCDMMSPEDAQRMLAEGSIESPSARTGQALRVGAASLREQRDDPAAHDLRSLAAFIPCPVLLVHGADDQAVPIACVDELAAAIGERARTRVLPRGDHVFNTPNPMATDASMSEQLAALVASTIDFAREVCSA